VVKQFVIFTVSLLLTLILILCKDFSLELIKKKDLTSSNSGMEEMILEEVQQFVNFLKPMAAGKCLANVV
jgi:hypothetical protein